MIKFKDFEGKCTSQQINIEERYLRNISKYYNIRSKTFCIFYQNCYRSAIIQKLRKTSKSTSNYLVVYVGIYDFSENDRCTDLFKDHAFPNQDYRT